MLEGFMAIANVVEEILEWRASTEKRQSQLVYSQFAPSSQKGRHRYCEQVHHPISRKVLRNRQSRYDCAAYLIIESTLLIQEIEEFRITFASPEFEAADFKITPDLEVVSTQCRL